MKGLLHPFRDELPHPLGVDVLFRHRPTAAKDASPRRVRRLLRLHDLRRRRASQFGASWISKPRSSSQVWTIQQLKRYLSEIRKMLVWHLPRLLRLCAALQDASKQASLERCIFTPKCSNMRSAVSIGRVQNQRFASDCVHRLVSLFPPFRDRQPVVLMRPTTKHRHGDSGNQSSVSELHPRGRKPPAHDNEHLGIKHVAGREKGDLVIHPQLPKQRIAFQVVNHRSHGDGDTNGLIGVTLVVSSRRAFQVAQVCSEDRADLVSGSHLFFSPCAVRRARDSARGGQA